MATLDPYVRYSVSLNRAKAFLEGNKKTMNGSPLSPTQLLLLLQHRADCPLCGVVFEGTNHNTEHIHPRALGGTNDADNKIQLCKNCNNCRNSILQRLLLTPPYHATYPENWERVQTLILWSEQTIDDGLSAGEAFPEVHEKFLEERFAGELPRNGPSRAFGRASTFANISGPNYAHNGTMPPTSAAKASRPGRAPSRSNTSQAYEPGVFTRFFDRIFGHHPPSNQPPQPTAALVEEMETATPDDALPATFSEAKSPTKEKQNPSNPNPKVYPVVDEEFYEIVLGALEAIEGEVHLPHLPHLIETYLESKGREKMTFKQLTQSYGIPNRRTAVEIIEHYFSDKIGYRREGKTVVYIWKIAEEP